MIQIRFPFRFKSMKEINAAVKLGMIQQTLKAILKVITIDGQI